jgi:hypothetical protein
MAAPASAMPILDNIATAVATQSQPHASAEAWQVTSNTGPTSADNAAEAVSENCTGCRAIALAFQVIIVSYAGNLALTNNATSINTNCLTCTATSVAEQWVVADTSAQIRLTPAGQFTLALLHLELSLVLRLAPNQAGQVAVEIGNEIGQVLAQDVVVVPGISPPAVVEPLFGGTGITITHHVQESP